MKFNKLYVSALALAGVLSDASFIHLATASPADELVFATPPSQSAEETVANYMPLVNYLSQASGKKITIKSTSTWFEYSREMRDGKYDLVFDGPHFIKYRIDNLQHVVLAKEPGDLRFVVVVKKDSPVQNLNGLVTKGMCAPNIPHLGTLTVLGLFPNPSRQPELKPVQGFKEAMKCIDSDKAQAAVLRDKFWEKNVANKDDYRIIHTTERKMPARGMTISAKVDLETRTRIAKALLDVNGNKILEQAFSTIGGSRFVFADQKDYDGLEELLQVVWGFHI